jgi:3-hydroxybutyryl-CoA dehydrogenase
MEIEDIETVLIVGAGTMGQQIASQCALHGFVVILYDIKQDILDHALVRINKLLAYFVSKEKYSQKAVDAAFKRISCTTRAQEAAAKADLISESVPEDPDLKKKVFFQFHALCPEHTIFTTNTSTLVPSMFAEGTGRPHKLAALHFHDVRTTNIVDVMAHPGTSGETLRIVIDFARKIGQLPIVLAKESPGYVFNFLLTALLQAAQTLSSNGVASIEEVDRAWMGVMHVPIGPFGLMDGIGIDTLWKAADYWANQSKDEQNRKNAAFLKNYVDQGLLGQKTGQGFYTYPKPSYREPGFLVGE